MFPRWKPKPPGQLDVRNAASDAAVAGVDVAFGSLVFQRHIMRIPPASVVVVVPGGICTVSEVTASPWRIVTSARTSHGGGTWLDELPSLELS